MPLLPITIIVLVILVAQTAFLVIQWRRPDLLYSYHNFPFYPRERYFQSRHLQQLLWVIDDAEHDVGIELTWGAREMLIIPIVESMEAKGFDWDEAYRSVRDVVYTIKDSDERETKRFARDGTRNSVSVIRGFWKRFCNIPPFCSRREEGVDEQQFMR